MTKINFKIKTCLLLFAGALSIFGSFAGNLYNLDDLEKLLKQDNLLLKIAEIDRDIVTQEYRSARAPANPEIEIFKGEGEFLEKPGKSDVWGIALNISLPNPLYRFYFLKSLKKNQTRAEIEAQIKENSIIRELREHYFRLQFGRKMAALLQEKMYRLTEVNRLTKAKALIGEAKEIDFLRTEVEIRKNKSLLFKTEKMMSYEKIRIKELLDYSPGNDFSIVEDFAFAPLAGIEKRIETLIGKSPLVILKLNEISRKKLAVKSGKFSLIESVHIFGERGKEIEAVLWKFGIGLSIPVFNTKSAEVKKAKLERQKAEQEFARAEKHLFADINRIVFEIRVLEQEIETFTALVLQEGRHNIELSQKLFREGEIPLVVFFDAQNSFSEVEQRYYEAITEWKILKAALEEVLGEKI